MMILIIIILTIIIIIIISFYYFYLFICYLLFIIFVMLLFKYEINILCNYTTYNKILLSNITVMCLITLHIILYY